MRSEDSGRAAGTHFLSVSTPAGWPGNVLIAQTTRSGGVSLGPYASLNLGTHVGDDPVAVAQNRDRLLASLPAGARIAWLRQVHGTDVIEAEAEAGPLLGDAPAADACWTAQARIACAIMTADCLPVLLTDASGAVVAAAHAGWRGLAAGILEATVAAMGVAPGTLHAWLGPAIGADAFEVGSEVRDTFLAAASPGSQATTERCFRPSGIPGHWYADLAALAELRLRARGVRRVTCDGRCTVRNPGTFFSHRRDGTTGRMASLILRLEP
jgi:YfiH family protein